MPLGSSKSSKKEKKSASSSASATGSFARPADDAAAVRSKQIDSLRTYFPTVREAVKDARYEVPLGVAGSRRQIVLVVELAPDFPRSPPSLSLPGEAHRYLDAQGRVMPTAHANLKKWTVHSNLGRNVYEIVQLFMKDPPTPAQQPQASASPSPQVAHVVAAVQPPAAHGYSMPAAGGSGSSVNVRQPSHQGQLPIGQAPSASPSLDRGQSWHGSMAPIPNSFPELHQKSPAELQRLLTDEAYFHQFFDTLPAVQTMKRVRDEMAQGNEELARRNMAVEAEIEAFSRSLNSKSENVDSKKREYEELVRRQQTVMKQFSTPILVDRLADAAQDAEDESDAIADELLHGSLNQRDFVKKFLPVRNLYHLRSAKKESLTLTTQRA